MKILVIPLICLAGLLVFISSASADFKKYVVYQGDEPCTTGNDTFQYSKPDSYSCNPNNLYCETTNAGGFHNAIQEAYWNTCDSRGDTIIICPGTYQENIYMMGCGNQYLTITSYSQDPTDTTVVADDPSENVFFIHGGHGRTISGLTIIGATDDVGDYGCARRHDGNDTPSYMNENPNQPCAGVRFFCTVNGIVTNNIIKENNHGVIVKDTYYGWSFFNFVENNDIFNNTGVGVHLRYGSNSYISNNWISGNPVGIHLVDTWENKVVGNSINDDSVAGVTPAPDHLGIQIKASNIVQNWGQYDPGEATSANTMYNNNIFDTTTAQIDDDYPDPVRLDLNKWSGKTLEIFKLLCPADTYGVFWCQHYWYEPNLQIGNYWDTGTPFYDPYPRTSLYDYTSMDLDSDGKVNYEDNCPDVPNPLQEDYDNNGIGDACDCPNNVFPNDKYARNMFEYLNNDNHVGTFDSLQDAYDWVKANQGLTNSHFSFQIKAAIFSEPELVIDLSGTNKRFSELFSGYDCNYTASNGVTTLKGQLRVKSGNLVLKKGTFKVAKSN